VVRGGNSVGFVSRPVPPASTLGLSLCSSLLASYPLTPFYAYCIAREGACASCFPLSPRAQHTSGTCTGGGAMPPFAPHSLLLAPRSPSPTVRKSTAATAMRTAQRAKAEPDPVGPAGVL